MRFFVLASLVVACGTTTFTSEDAGTMMVPVDGSAMPDTGAPICTPPCIQVAAIDVPTCLEANAGYLFYATDSGIVGRVEKTTSVTATVDLQSPTVDCTLYGATLLVALGAGPVVSLNAVTLSMGAGFNGQMNRRITSHLLGTSYLAGIRTDGLWGCDATNTCRMFPSSLMLSSIATDGDYVYYTTEAGIFRNGTTAPAGETLGMTTGVTAITLDFNNLLYASGNELWQISKAPPAVQPKKIVSQAPGVLWLMTDFNGLYWSTADGVYGSQKDGGSQKQYATRQPQPIRIVTDDANVYWINHAPKANGGGIYRAPKK